MNMPVICISAEAVGIQKLILIRNPGKEGTSLKGDFCFPNIVSDTPYKGAIDDYLVYVLYLEYLFHMTPRTSSKIKMMMVELRTTMTPTAQSGILRMISGSSVTTSTSCRG